MKKIFNLGLPKTGTTSFHNLMEAVNIKSVHDKNYREDIDSFSGLISHKYEELYERFPDSKYVLTIRDEKDWLQSVKYHFSPLRMAGHGKVNFRKEIFGTKYVSTLTDKELLNIYNNWNNTIRDFFKDKDNFMEINFINYFGDSKQICRKLLNFLEIDIDKLDVDFPHKNKSRENIKSRFDELMGR